MMSEGVISSNITVLSRRAAARALPPLTFASRSTISFIFTTE